MATVDQADRYSRQQDLIPADRLAPLTVTVIGVGAGGRQVARMLACIGVPRLQLIDPDVVEPVNLCSQAYPEFDLGSPKVKATAEECRRLNNGVVVTARRQRFALNLDIGDVVFCCVDSIQDRTFIWNCVKDKVLFWADGRMSADVLRVLTAHDAASREHYSGTLFPPEQAFHGSCTSRSTIYGADVAAGLMMAQFSKWLRGLPVEADVQLNLLTMELTVKETSRDRNNC